LKHFYHEEHEDHEGNIMPAPVETISDGSDPIAIIIRADFNEPGVHFLTPAHFSQQLAVMRHPQGKVIAPHVHNPVSRQVLYTQEVLLIRKGRIKVTLYTSLRKRLQSVELTTGDLILLCGGGHAFEMLEETDMVEVKQGPYAGENDKTRFDEAGS
jgi:mannose-6-phosphate isomerase-like protein (cupin superfamily)